MFLRVIFIISLFWALGPVAKADPVALNAEARSSSPDTQPSNRTLDEAHSALHSNPPEEIALEANVVQIILNDEHRSGVDWGAIVSDFHTAPLKKANDPNWNNRKYRLSFGTVSQDDYTVLIDALDTVGKMSQFPQAPVRAFSGKPGGIDFEKQNIRVDLLLARLRSGELSLRVAPHFSLASTEIWDGQKAPSSVVLQSETNMMIADNMTIVIGGFMKEEEITRTRKFPLLGDLPIFDLVFRSRGRLMQRTETIIFLTVRTNAVDVPEEGNPS